MKPERASELFEKLNKRKVNQSAGGVYNSVAVTKKHLETTQMSELLSAAGLKASDVALAIKNVKFDKLKKENRPFSTLDTSSDFTKSDYFKARKDY